MNIELILQINKVHSSSEKTNTQINFYVNSEERHKVVHTINGFCDFNDNESPKKFIFNDEAEFRKFSSILTAVYTTFGLNYYEIMKGLIDEYREKGEDVESKHSFSIDAH